MNKGVSITNQIEEQQNSDIRVYSVKNTSVPIELINDSIVRVEDACQRISTEPLIILRILLVAFELGYQIESKTLDACLSYVTQIHVSEARSELREIKIMDPFSRQAFIAYIYRIGIGEQIISLLRTEGIELITSNKDLSRYITALRDFLGFSSFYVYGGALRDAALELSINDVDVKVIMSPNDFVALLENKGYKEIPEDQVISKDQYSFNRTFNGVRFMVGEITYDFTFLQDLNLDSWYEKRDLNCNALIFDVSNGTVLNSELLEMVVLGILELCVRTRNRSLISIYFISFFKQVSRRKGLILDQQSLDLLESNTSRIIEQLKGNPLILSLARSIIGKENSSQSIEIIKSFPEGSDLLSLIEV